MWPSLLGDLPLGTGYFFQFEFSLRLFADHTGIKKGVNTRCGSGWLASCALSKCFALRLLRWTVREGVHSFGSTRGGPGLVVFTRRTHEQHI